ncbi:MAG: IS110 family RNA-guided transposase [Sulfobacillus sp.]
MDLDVVVTHGAGLDIHKKVIVATVLTPTVTETRSFGTHTPDLLDLADWLQASGVTHVAMEATGVYWKPVVNLFEAYPFDAVMVVNPQHIKGLPGRKTDVQDSQWIAGLLRLGALKASYIPPRPQRELRELVRYRTSLQQTRATESNRIQKVLEGANVKLGSVISDVLGVTGHRILTALANGETDPRQLADLADHRIRASRETLIAALTGLVNAHQRLMLRVQLQHVAFLDRQLTALSQEIATRLINCDDALARLQTIPGVERRTAEVIIAEIGTDMHRFPSAGHLVSWAGFSPAQDESAGKARATRTRKGSKALRAALTQSGHAAGKTQTYLGAVYHRLTGRRGKQRAAVAVGRHILLAVYAILRDSETVFDDLGVHYFDQRDPSAVVRREIRRLQSLGYRVTVEPLTPEAS